MQEDKTMRIIGYRQVIRALEAGTLVCAQIAMDADGHLKEKLLSAFDSAQVPYRFVPTRKELGKQCGINVGAAVVGTVENA